MVGILHRCQRYPILEKRPATVVPTNLCSRIPQRVFRGWWSEESVVLQERERRGGEILIQPPDTTDLEEVSI
jgi:hypothetical protein